MTTPSSSAELDARVEAALAQLRQRHAKSGPPCRYLDAATRKRVSAGVIRYHAQRVANDPEASPLKRARYARAWSLKTTGERAGLALNSVWAAEKHPEKANWRTKVAISRALGVPTKTLFPENAQP